MTLPIFCVIDEHLFERFEYPFPKKYIFAKLVWQSFWRLNFNKSTIKNYKKSVLEQDLHPCPSVRKSNTLPHNYPVAIIANNNYAFFYNELVFLPNFTRSLTLPLPRENRWDYYKTRSAEPNCVMATAFVITFYVSESVQRLHLARSPSPSFWQTELALAADFTLDWLLYCMIVG